MYIKMKYVIIALITVVFILSGFIWYTSYLNNIISEKIDTIKIQTQNEIALKNQIKMKADSLQDFALFIQNLQKENENIKNKYILLKSKYTILIDSINVNNSVAITDTSGDSVTVKFDGKRGKVSYKGKTIYFKSTNSGTYTISIVVDPTNISSEIYYDKDSNIVKNKIYADGALITDAKTILDSSLYILTQNNELNIPDEKGFFDNLHIVADVNQSIRKDGLIYIPDKFSVKLGMEYQFNSIRIYSNYDILNPNYTIGLQYHPSIVDIWKLIFQ